MRQAIFDLIAVVSDNFDLNHLVVGVLTSLFSIQVIRGGLHITESRVAHHPITNVGNSDHQKTSRFEGDEAETRGQGYIIGGLLGILFGLLIIHI